jgi:hypothetical protein
VDDVVSEFRRSTVAVGSSSSDAAIVIAAAVVGIGVDNTGKCAVVDGLSLFNLACLEFGAGLGNKSGFFFG